LGQNPRNPKVTGEIISAAGTGKVGFISSADIADAAVEKLTAPSPYTSGDPIIVGPDLLSYDEVVELFTTVLGRQIKHKSISLEELIEVFTKAGLPEALAKGLAQLDVAIANGAEEAVYNADNRIVGKRHLKDFILENKEKWA
jgi:festuclavine dehydrogenase